MIPMKSAGVKSLPESLLAGAATVGALPLVLLQRKSERRAQPYLLLLDLHSTEHRNSYHTYPSLTNPVPRYVSQQPNENVPHLLVPPPRKAYHLWKTKFGAAYGSTYA